MIPLSRNDPEPSSATPAGMRGKAREPKALSAWPAAAAVFLTALLACGTGFSQEPSPAADAPVSPLLRQGTILEEELSAPGRAPAAAIRETAPEARPVPGPPPGPATSVAPSPTAPGTGRGILVDGAASDKPDGSYELPPIAPVAGAGLPRRRASMKLVQQGQVLLRNEQYRAALGTFEQAIGIDATNPYSHYFTARAHYMLGNYRESLSFLEVSELKLGADARWLAEVHVLRGRNAAASGFHGRADKNYVRALSLDPRHEFALAQLTTIETLAGARPGR